jgi:AraC family transcriptional regulator
MEKPTTRAGAAARRQRREGYGGEASRDRARSRLTAPLIADSRRRCGERRPLALGVGCPGGRLYGEALATDLAVHLLQHYAVCSPELRSYRGGLPQVRLRRVLEYMQDHLDQELSLMALAAVAQMSPYYFSRLFKQSTGLSPHQYLLWQRMEHAKHLLSDSRRTIAEVSDALGFPHQSHFATTFHTLVGMTPGEYRRQRSGR